MSPAMKEANVPGIYTEPAHPLIVEAIECWKNGVVPREARRRLRSRARIGQ